MTQTKRDMRLWREPHRSRAKALCDAAYRNPKAVCWLCGKTLAEVKHRNGRPSTWHADHVIPGDPRSPLRLAHSVCNERRGAAHVEPAREPVSPNA